MESIFIVITCVFTGCAGMKEKADIDRSFPIEIGTYVLFQFDSA